jgi:ABC-2 type transport system ATP-binding protein
MTPLLEVNQVRKQYGPTVALEGVSFQVYPGEMFGLLGPNGAGKTTLLSILSCLLEATSGEVRVLGQRVWSGNREVRRLIGIVPQELAIYEDLTAGENLLFFGELYGFSGPTLRKRIDQILSAVGLLERKNDRARSFSGGMKRRLNLGAALVHQPRLLLLDEPTVGVDPQSRNHIFEEVRRLNSDGMTVVYTSHYMEEVQALCPRIGIIDHGRLRACDTLPNLLRELDGLIRFRIPQLTPELRGRIKAFPDCRLVELDAPAASISRFPGRLSSTQISAISTPHSGLPATPATPQASGEQLLDLHCRDVKATLIRLVACLNEAQVELISLDTEEPNLERVFLHLTGHELRD